jgi:hypothetical protein
MPANTAITIGVYCTLFFEILAFWLCGSVFRVDSSLFAVSVAPGWIPVVIVWLRIGTKKIDRVTSVDVGLMIFGFPIIFGVFAAVTRLFL